MKRWLVYLLVICVCLPLSGALALTGQSYDAFSQSYKDNVSFINNNDNRHLLPMVLSQRKSSSDDGRVYYDLIGDVLNVIVTTDSVGVIEDCEIRLTAPANMEYGSIVYNDFAISGYHSFAFLMAMDSATDPAKRYELVTDVVQGMKDNQGAYTRQIGAYTLTCTRDSTMAVLSFINNGVPVETPTPAPTASPDPNTTPDPNATPDANAPTDAPADGFIG